MPRVSLEAVFKATGLDNLGRAFDTFNAKMRRMADVTKAFGAGTQAEDAFRRQFKIGAELDLVNARIGKARNLYGDLLAQMDKTSDPKRRADLQTRLQIIERIATRELETQAKLQRGLAEEGAAMGRLTFLRRGLRLGLAVAGVPATIAGLGRVAGEAQEQEKLVAPLAARLRELNRPAKDFTEFTMDLRKGIVDAGAALAFSGREAIQLADTLVTLSGGMTGFQEALEASRGLGVSPQVTTQLVGMARRFGGIGGAGQMSDEKLINTVARGIAESGMMPRGSEYIQSIVQTMQAYSTRLPSVQPDTIASVIAAINRTRIPTLRGQGATQVTEGVTRMMDDMSEAMIAVQTELIGRNPEAFAGAARRYGVSGAPTGTERFMLAMALKQEGLATQDGLRLAGETIKFITGGQDRATRIIMESMLLRMPVGMVDALEKKGFMDQLREGRITTQEFAKRVQDFQAMSEETMRTPAMAWARLGRAIGSRITTTAERGLVAPFAPEAGAAAEMMEEGMTAWALPGLAVLAIRKKMKEAPLRMIEERMAEEEKLKATGQYLYGPGQSLAGQALEAGRGAVEGQFRHAVDVTVRIVGSGIEAGEGIGRGIASIVSRILGQNVKDSAEKSQRSIGIHSMADAMNHDMYGTSQR